MGGDAEPGASAEAAAAGAVVERHQHHAVLGTVPEQIGQRVGQFGRRAQGDLGVVGGWPERDRTSGDVAVFGRSGGFAVIRHAQTISRIL
ncbi:hypothetical protein ACWCYL_27890 [Streptomyces sp. 900105755]